MTAISDQRTDDRTTSVFVTDDGERIACDPSHRARVKPDSGDYRSARLSGADGRLLIEDLRRTDGRVALGERLLDLYGKCIEGADVLVVGASDATEVAAIVGRGARSVVGIDFGDAFAPCSEEADPRSQVVSRALSFGADLGWRADRGQMLRCPVRFLIDDIARSRLASGSFDIIMSWQTLEHVMDLESAALEMARLLRPGGYAYHEYNSFFAIDGGHTPATLDAPWMHAMLSPGEVGRFLQERRPDEAESALSFYNSALNRRSQAQVREAFDEAGLMTHAWIPRFRAEDALLLTPPTAARVMCRYPTAAVEDLTSRIVRCVHERR